MELDGKWWCASCIEWAATLPAVVATCIVAPVVEELLFRGILLRSFLEHLSILVGIPTWPVAGVAF